MTKYRVRAALSAACVLALSGGTSASAHDRMQSAIIRALSNERAKVGAPALRAESGLHAIAQAHSREMALTGTLDHGSWEARIRRVVPRGAVGETLAMIGAAGSPVRRLVAAWMASPPHRAILLDPHLRRIGVAWHRSAQAWFFTADLSAA